MLTVGLDEAGRGPLAGPVTAACVVLPESFPLEILNDSKKLSEKKRDSAAKIIKETAWWGFARVEQDVIDKINILQASLLAMSLAWQNMVESFKDGRSEFADLKANFHAIVDGLYVPKIECSAEAVVKADAKYPEVMAASIIAKTERDRIMKEYDKLYPEYGYATHKGYPTAAHKEVCRRLGPSPIQRLTFKY